MVVFYRTGSPEKLDIPVFFRSFPSGSPAAKIIRKNALSPVAKVLMG
jgi:hypothetical protein